MSTDDGKVHLTVSYHSSSAPKITTLTNAQALAGLASRIIADPKRLGGFEGSMKTVNPSLELVLYDKTFALNVSEADKDGTFPEGWFQHSSAVASKPNRILSVSKTYQFNTQITTASASPEGLAATNAHDWHILDLEADLSAAGADYTAVFQDINALGAFNQNCSVYPTDLSVAAGSTTVTVVSSACLSSAMVGRGVTLDTGGVGGVSMKASVVSVNTGAQTLVMDAPAGNTVVTSGKIGAQAWSPPDARPYTQDEFMGNWLIPLNTDVRTALSPIKVENNGGVNGQDWASYYKAPQTYFTSGQSMATFADAIQVEHWLRNDGDNSTTFPTNTSFIQCLQQAYDIQAAGAHAHLKMRLGFTDNTSPAAYQRWRHYAIASYLLANSGKASLDISKTDADSFTEIQNAIYQTALGAPIDSFTNPTSYQVGVGKPITGSTTGKSYYRRYAGGIVIVVTDEAGPVTLTLDKSYIGVDGDASGQVVTLSPGSSMIALAGVQSTTYRVFETPAKRIRVASAA